MAFNSAGFLLVFLPATLLLYHLLFARSDRTRQPFLIAATLLFYAVGGARFLPLLLLSLVANHAAARWITDDRRALAIRRCALVLGIGFNVLLLCYFKYAGFLVGNANLLFGAGLSIPAIALPLGISFYTFQQIGFLIDLSRRRVARGGALDHAGFLLFFPYLLSGPIVRHDEVAAQFRQPPPRGRAASGVLIGLTIFAFGLFKKVGIADTIGTLAAPVFDAAAAGHVPGLIDAWIAAFAYTAQIYFDFSGYSDMAIGVARMFGIVLPLNFHSPLRATSIVDLWRRWHVTLSRWVQTYVFQPLSMPFARFAADRTTNRTMLFLIGVAAPTMLSMIAIGVWHGAGWTFVLFGAMQGSYMAINEYWRLARRKARKASRTPAPAYAAPLSRAVTLVAFVVATVAFRAADLPTVGRFYRGLTGIGGWIDAPLVAARWGGGLAGGLLLTGLVYAIIYCAPNTQQIMARCEPVLEWSRWRLVDAPHRPVEWKPTMGWTILTALILFAGFVAMMRGTTNFIYFNF